VLNANGAWPPYGANEISVRRPYYVGDEYCDLIGIDLYNFDPVNRGKYHTFNITYRNVWDLMKAITPNKMIALCEAEGFPDPQKCFTDPTYAPWLYCLPWYTQNYWDEATNKNIDLISWNKSVFKSDFVKNAPF
jgi:hypothetical protein